MCTDRVLIEHCHSYKSSDQKRRIPKEQALPTSIHISSTDFLDHQTMDLEKGATEPLTTKGSSVNDVQPEQDSPSKVKFTPGSLDGNIKEAVDIVSPGRENYGLSKSELMVYANDPTWKRIRMGVFVLFWLVWLALLGASIFIVSTSTCQSRKQNGN